ncbi:MAG: mucoidy inhibitor MuiA family protein [Firmicutes bacterium]|nr:mucoidy inhibitor MuiA family protein [Bacillota bacterium]
MSESKIKEVSVYKSGCIVKRQGTVHLEKGSQTVKLQGLKAADGNFISSDSVKLAVDERVTGSNIQVESLSGREVADIVKPITDKIAAKKKELDVLQLQEDMWKTNSDFTNKESVSIESMVNYIESLEERLTVLNAKKTAVEEELKVLSKDLDEHQKDLSEPYVKADLSCAEEGDYAYEISYYCNDVYWMPFYEVHTDDETESLDIRLRAKVRQNTTEDWEGIKLSLYAMDPSLSGTIPTLYPTYLNFFEPVMMNSAGMRLKSAAKGAAYQAEECAVMDDAAPMMMMGAAAAPVFKEVQTQGASFKSNDSVLEYELEGTWDLPKGKEIICDLTSQQVECRYHDICVPKLDTKVYLAAEVKTSDIEELMDTDASIYIKGTYMGDAYLDIDLSKDTYDISLGVDETVKVTRKQTKKYSSNVLLKSQKKTELVYEITATSKKDRKCELLLEDQVPVSNEKTIEVSVDNVSGAEHDAETGKLKWNIELDKMETVKKTLAYTVAYPKDKVIRNL